MTIKEAAAAWGITERRVNELCKTGRISGAYKEGRQWFIPDGTHKPMDKRSRRSAGKPAVSSAHKPLPIGVSDYRDACKNYYYVDKTLMIKEFLDERPKVSLFTRPRRFGKTLNMTCSVHSSKRRPRTHPFTSETRKSGFAGNSTVPITESIL